MRLLSSRKEWENHQHKIGVIMKRFLSIALLLIFGCAAQKEVGKIVLHYGFDFTKYTAQGFLFTPETYTGSYESIGIVKTIIFPAVKHSKEQKQKESGDFYLDENWVVEDLEANEAVDELYKRAVSMGANAVTKFDIRRTEYMNGYVVVPGFEVTGFAIKIKR